MLALIKPNLIKYTWIALLAIAILIFLPVNALAYVVGSSDSILFVGSSKAILTVGDLVHNYKLGFYPGFQTIVTISPVFIFVLFLFGFISVAYLSLRNFENKQHLEGIVLAVLSLVLLGVGFTVFQIVLSGSDTILFGTW